jgi:hypothetical protein
MLTFLNITIQGRTYSIIVYMVTGHLIFQYNGFKNMPIALYSLVIVNKWVKTVKFFYDSSMLFYILIEFSMVTNNRLSDGICQPIFFSTYSHGDSLEIRRNVCTYLIFADIGFHKNAPHFWLDITLLKHLIRYAFWKT